MITDIATHERRMPSAYINQGGHGFTRDMVGSNVKAICSIDVCTIRADESIGFECSLKELVSGCIDPARCDYEFLALILKGPQGMCNMRGKGISIIEDGAIHVHRYKPKARRVWSFVFNHASIVNENSAFVIMKIAKSFLTEFAWHDLLSLGK